MIDISGGGEFSSLSMAYPWFSKITALVALLRVSKNQRSTAIVSLPMTVTVFVVSPMSKVSEPETAVYSPATALPSAVE